MAIDTYGGLRLTRQTEDALKKSFCLLLQLECDIPQRVQIDKKHLDIDADKDLLTSSIKLWDCKELEAIKKHDAETRKYLSKQGLGNILKGGVYFEPAEMFNEIEATLETRREQREFLVEQFGVVYEQRIDEMRARAREAWNPRNYLTWRQAREQFVMEWFAVHMSTPDFLAQVDRYAFKKSQEKYERLWENAVGNATMLMRMEMTELVGHMAERLTGTDTGKREGKPKIFRDSMVTKMTEFLRTFKARNIADDTELTRLAEEAKRLLDGVDLEDLRNSERVREKVAEGMTRIKTALDTSVITRPERAISFSDE